MAYCFIKRHVNVPGTMWCECGSLVAGTPIDGYNVISYLGHGTSGDVYLAEQAALNNRKVVIKIAHRSWSQSDIDNFRREAALLASLSHPYILPIYGYGVIYERQSTKSVIPSLLSGQALSGAKDDKSADFTYSPYLVLAYAEQGSLEEAFIRAGKQPWSLMRVVSLAQEIAEALDYAHSRGVLHRDVKPANLLYMGSHVLLSDFSVASLIDAEASHLNAPWAGSPAYMAPEVWRHSPGRYSDQYALAITCFRLLAGDYPWAKMNEGNVQEWLHLHCHVPPRSLQAYRPNLPRAVDLVLQKGMAKDPHKRYETVQAFAVDLLSASEDKTQVLDKSAQEAAINRGPTPLPLDVQTGGKEWQIAIGGGNILVSDTPIPRLEVSQRADTRFPTHPPALYPTPAPTGEENSPIMAAVEPVTEGIKKEEQGSGRQVGEEDQIDRRATMADQSAVGTINRPLRRANNRWLWCALILNGLICLLLAAEAYWQSKNIMSAGNLLLALWPSVLIGPLIARWFRRIRLTTLSWGIFWGVFFGMTNVLLSGLVCYIWVALAETIPHWGYDWQRAGDGLRIFVSQIVGLAQPALTPLLLSLWLAALGGSLIGIFIYRTDRHPER